MRVRSLLVPEGLYGLRESLLSRLGPVVVLAGPNGSGKSRVLRLLAAVLAEPSAAKVATYRDLVAASQTRLSVLHRQRASTQLPDVLERTDETITKVQSEEIEFEAMIRAAAGITLDGAFQLNSVMNFLLKPAKLSDYRQRSLDDIRVSVDTARKVSTEELAKWVGPYVHEMDSLARAAEDPTIRMGDDAREMRRAGFSSLNALIATFVGEPLERHRNGDPALFGKPLYDAQLSEGQSVLLQLAVALHARGAQLGSFVLLLDEPENHLHPEALLSVLTRLREVIGEGQLWIATHSVNVLAWAGPEAIWYMDAGKASWAGRQPERVLRGLLGDEEQRRQLEDFLQLPAQFASNRFAAQCLHPPDAVDTGPSDPQLGQIRVALRKLPEGESVLRVLDFGAGRGRLLPALVEEFGGASAFRERVDYRALELDDTHREQRVANLVSVYGEGEEERDIPSMIELKARLDDHSVDVVVMCNVLHEIEPGAWPDEFRDLQRVLKNRGYLLVVEDQRIPTGEKAHNQGFLILDGPHLAKLFGRREQDPKILSNHRADGRLTAHLVPAVLLDRVTRDTRRAALELLRDSCELAIRGLRKGPASGHNGHLHGLYAQMLANATLALKAL